MEFKQSNLNVEKKEDVELTSRQQEVKAEIVELLSSGKISELVQRGMVFSEKILLLPDVRKVGKQVALDSFLHGDIKSTGEVLRFFSPKSQINAYDSEGDIAKLIKDEFDITDEEMQQRIEFEIDEALSSKLLSRIVRIQKLGLTSPEIVKNKDGFLELIGERLHEGLIEDLRENIKLFELDDCVGIIDDLASSFQIPKKDFIKFVKFLGDEDFINKFPKTFERVRGDILKNLGGDEDLADYFLENLEKYYSKLPDIEKALLSAVQHYSVALKFFDVFDKNIEKEWKNEPWAKNVLGQVWVVMKKHEHGDEEDEGHSNKNDYDPTRHGNEGFSEIDPYENHSWRFGRNQVLMASGIARIISGENLNEIVIGKTNEEVPGEYPVRVPHASKKDLADWRYELSVSELGSPRTIQKEEKIAISKEVREELEATRNKIEIAYQDFIAQIRSNPNIKDEDKKALLDPESLGVDMTPLLDNVRSFVARYFVGMCEGNMTKLQQLLNQPEVFIPDFQQRNIDIVQKEIDDLYSRGHDDRSENISKRKERIASIEAMSVNLDGILSEVFKRYIKIFEVDVPLYDKLYEEFDNLRETGRNPLEVYLGRDGIYAWIGRRTQDVARRRKLGLEGRKKQKEMGEVLEIHPKYTVYPRYFRDNINYETKRKFLEQEGISPDADPLFYDTGYTGTIPEQIMRVMDFSDKDIEQRIRLLSAPSAHRRIKGIPENARSEIVEYIEHNAKTEETAEGLIIDEKTGRIRHIAQPTNPEEQFYFMMVKQAIARHYWVQERLHHEPSGNVNLDSEHYTIRIRQEYSKLLPQEFIHDPKAFFTQHGELLKSSKGEGEYPDEEVVLFKMINGTEIVAKKIELRKVKEARKEFSILISAKKAGLPTAEPVGFLSGKEESDGSYLLMKKIEGISGRNFDKYLRDSGRFTEEKIKSILQQVAEKNKEMAELFRTTLKIDKRWRIKDTIIEFNEETGEVDNVIPIDWERAQNFNPATPKEIDEIN
ncbi:MAG: hypothetical protein Q7K54_04565 [Candidatus Parcubacteria bacterium]|nr:hypothetical protein [Candidatus Parcubacteria bacterium]